MSDIPIRLIQTTLFEFFYYYSPLYLQTPFAKIKTQHPVGFQPKAGFYILTRYSEVVIGYVIIGPGIVFPSGIIGPGDLQGGSFTSMAKSFLAGKLPLAVRGGYDFVDVRDVANGLLACSESGEPGKGYILSGHYVTIRKILQLVGKTAKLKYRPICLPLGFAKLAAPYYERRSLRERKPLFFTPYSVSVLASNGQFSHAAASERFAYQPRPIEETLGDMTAWLLNQK